jgi:hypothetical protein
VLLQSCRQRCRSCISVVRLLSLLAPLLQRSEHGRQHRRLTEQLAPSLTRCGCCSGCHVIWMQRHRIDKVAIRVHGGWLDG